MYVVKFFSCTLLHVIVNAEHYERKDQKVYEIQTEGFSTALPKVYRIQFRVKKHHQKSVHNFISSSHYHRMVTLFPLTVFFKYYDSKDFFNIITAM